jgi:hypothetical protein
MPASTPTDACTLSAHRRELAVTLEMLVGRVEQVSVDLGASPYIATDPTRSLHACGGHRGVVAGSLNEQ